MNTVLVLDDDPSVLKFLYLLLTAEGYHVLEATSADSALAWRNRAEQIDVVVADVTLAVGSGISAAAQLRASFPKLRVILTSGLPRDNWTSERELELESLPPECATILQKPVTASALITAVKDFMGPAHQKAGGGSTV